MSTSMNSTGVPTYRPTVGPNPFIVVMIYRYGLGFVLLLGFIGNLSSIATFMSPALRTTSTACLFFMVAISDTLFLLLTIFDFVEVGIVQGPIFLSDYDNFCRFRWFSRGFIRFCSAWLLVTVAVDRWIRVYYPFKTKQWCTPKNAFISTFIIIVCSVALHSHLLNPANLARFLPGLPSLACGPANPFGSYVYFIFVHWPIIQVTLICIIPVILTLGSGISIYYMISKEKNLVQPAATTNNDRSRRQSRLQRHMLLLLIGSTVLFCATTLPISICQIVTAFLVSVGMITDINSTVVREAILYLLLTFNYATNFYIHCLASKLFRNEFLQCMKSAYRTQRSMVHASAMGPSNNELPLTTNHIIAVKSRQHASCN